MSKAEITNQQGMSLIELLMYCAIFSLVFLVIVSFVIWLYQTSFKFQAMRQVEESAREALTAITREIRSAEGLYSPVVLPNQLSLVSANHLPAGESLTYLDFFLCGQRLCLKKESQAPLALTSDKVKVSYLEFNQLKGPNDQLSVQTVITLEHQRPEVKAFLTATSTTALRSY